MVLTVVRHTNTLPVTSIHYFLLLKNNKKIKIWSGKNPNYNKGIATQILIEKSKQNAFSITFFHQKCI